MSDPKALLLKATPVLLDGWCGPAMFVAEGDKLANAIPCVYLGPGEHGGDLVFVPRHGVRELRRGLLYLDLARAECRDRVARVVAARVGAARVGAIPGERFFHYRDGCWRFERGFSFCADRSPEQWRIPFTVDLVVVALAALDPYDDTRLPDGSRLVDALALHMVATEVLGG